jgi:hypothetical protein
MVNIEELKRQFKVANVAGVGQCIIIPMDKFEPEWDEELLQAGHECHAREDGYVQVTLGPEKSERSRGRREGTPIWWTKEDEARLLKRLSELTGPIYQKCAKIVSEFPGRTVKALELKQKKLKRTSKKTQKEKVAPKLEDKPSTPVHIPPSTSVTDPYVPKILNKLTNDVDGILDILNEQNKIMDKLSCHVLMQALQLKEQKGEIKIPPGLWAHYANALLEDEKRFCDVFREKVKNLLEASS